MKPKEQALREAVERYGSAVAHHCRLVIGDPHLAEDLAQEVFTRLCEVVHNPKRDREDISWGLVRGILQNVLREYLRQKKRLNPLLPADWEAMDPRTPAGRADEEDQRKAVRALVERLLVPEQQAILGRHFLGMNLTQLAAFLGLPRSTVADYYDRGMMRLRDMAKDHNLLP